MKTMHLSLNKKKKQNDENHFEKEVVWVKDGIVSVDGKQFDLTNTVLELTVSVENNLIKIDVYPCFKGKGTPIYDRNHNNFTIACIYFDSSYKEFFIITNDKTITTTSTIYKASVFLSNFPNVTLMEENVGINSSILTIIESHFRKFWQIEDTNAQFPFHSLCNHIRVKFIFINTQLTHLIGNEFNNYVTLSITRNALFDGYQQCPLNHLIIPNGCEYIIKDDKITIGWNKDSSIELIPKKVERILVSGHSIQSDTGYVNIRLIKP